MPEVIANTSPLQYLFQLACPPSAFMSGFTAARFALRHAAPPPAARGRGTGAARQLLRTYTGTSAYSGRWTVRSYLYVSRVGG